MSEIIPTEAEFAAVNAIDLCYYADRYLSDPTRAMSEVAAIIATHTRPRAEAAEAKVRELEAKLDAVEIDNIGHAHALSMLRGLFGLPLDGTLYDEIWQRHLELMEADKLACADAAEAALQAAPDYESMHQMVRDAIMQVGNGRGEPQRENAELSDSRPL
jgi:hypothetical protein